MSRCSPHCSKSVDSLQSHRIPHSMNGNCENDDMHYEMVRRYTGSVQCSEPYALPLIESPFRSNRR